MENMTQTVLEARGVFTSIVRQMSKLSPCAMPRWFCSAAVGRP